MKDHNAWIWIAAIVAGFVASLLPSAITSSPNALPISVLVFVLTLAVAWWRWQVFTNAKRVAANKKQVVEEVRRREELRQQLSLCKLAEDLRPEDLRFQPLYPDQQFDLHHRPFYPTYLPRRIVPFYDPVASPTTAYDEAALRDELSAGRGFVLLGPPTAGKSRTVYEVICRLDGWIIVSPKKDQPTPTRETFEELFAGQRVVLLLEDLNDFAEAAVDLAQFTGPNGLGRAQEWVIAATCRDGPELGAVKEAEGRSIRRFYDEIPLKLALAPQTTDEKRELASSAGRREWDAERADHYPTPGTIVMEEALVFIRSRYDELPPDRRDVLRALKLLIEAGVVPLYQGRVWAVIEGVFHRALPHLGDCLEQLENAAFLRTTENQDLIVPEFAYLQDSVAPYDRIRRSVDDFMALAHVLETFADSQGLALLGYTYGQTLNDASGALEIFDAAIRIRPDYPEALYNRSVALHKLDRREEALDSVNTALHQWPDYAAALQSRGAILNELGRHAEALASLDASLEIRPNHPDTLVNRGAALVGLERYDEAVKDYDTALHLQPSLVEAKQNRAAALLALGRRKEALDALDAALRLHPDHPGLISTHGSALSELGRFEKALEAFKTVLEKNPENPDAWFNVGVAQANLGRYEEALTSYDAALRLRPDDASALLNRGTSLDALGRKEEALAVFESSLLLRPHHPDTLQDLGIVLSDLGRHQDALEALDLALAINPDHPEALQNRGIVLSRLDRLEEALTSYDASLRRRPDHPHVLQNRGNVLASLGRHEEAMADFDAALRFRPEFPEALSNRGNLFLALDRHEDALRDLNAALRLKLDFPNALRNRGLVFANLSRYDEALIDLKRALDLKPGDAGLTELIELVARLSNGEKPLDSDR